ncbi:MAG: hypothetical protein AAF298_12535 [Cyanobacteria bacterium P01_A01_bin.40]
MIELLYFASQIQCGAGGEFLDIQVNVYQNQELVETMVVEDRVLLPVDSVSDLTFEYSVINNDTSCSSLAAPSELVLAPDDELPNLAGFDQQDSVISLLSGLNEYQELFLVELGTTDTASSAFDMQDVTLRIDNNPVISLFAD